MLSFCRAREIQICYSVSLLGLWCNFSITDVSMNILDMMNENDLPGKWSWFLRLWTEYLFTCWVIAQSGSFNQVIFTHDVDVGFFKNCTTSSRHVFAHFHFVVKICQRPSPAKTLIRRRKSSATAAAAAGLLVRHLYEKATLTASRAAPLLKVDTCRSILCVRNYLSSLLSCSNSGCTRWQI